MSKLYVVVAGDRSPRGYGYNYQHIRAFESKARAESYAKKLREIDDYRGAKDAKVVEFVPKTNLEDYVRSWAKEQDIQSLNDFYEAFQSDNFPDHIADFVENILGAVLNEAK